MAEYIWDLASIVAEAPYHVPANIDFERLRAVFAARRSAAVDHIWALREDPGYVYDALGDCYEHRQEPMLDANKKPHPVLGTHIVWARVYGSVINSAYEDLIGFDSLYHQVERLISFREKYATKISPETALPREYMKALLVFRECLDIISKGPIENLKMAAPASPPIRSLFIREQPAPGSTIIPLRSRKGVAADYFLRLFQTLWDEKTLFLCRLPNLTDEIEDSSIAARKRKQNYFKDKELVNLKLETPFDGKFTYPSDKRRTQQHVEAMRKAEQNLDSFCETLPPAQADQPGEIPWSDFLHAMVSKYY